ncbi:C4-dicarboxylate ABC transporter [Skermanella stibiiresistens SB22]|uniref:C4-dicarboxylate ABC transporter n=2 Tax=Skermanella TaxID=204447 RepID=W9GU02_9PROT|nr:C4-dicarboxylate ABC transporter [Skermanella stibiiresistens SB22]
MDGLRTVRGLALALAVWFLPGAVAAQTSAEVRADAAVRDRVNGGTVGVISGGVDGTYVRIASDLAAVLDNREQLRVLPILGKGSLRNLTDILYLRGVDVGIVQSDVLAYAQREKLFPTIDKRVRYIAKLYNEEFHLLAGRDIGGVKDLAGRKVNFDVAGSGTEMTASLLFDRLGVAVERTSFDQALALEKLKSGEIAALAYVAGKPARLFRDAGNAGGDGAGGAGGLHFLPIPAEADLLDTYLPSQLGHDDYPGLIPDGQSVGTVAVGAVMAVYNWEEDNDRHRKVAAFTRALFDNFEEFRKPPRHAKWREVNLAAQVPGWTRFGAAERWLDTHKTD